MRCQSRKRAATYLDDPADRSSWVRRGRHSNLCPREQLAFKFYKNYTNGASGSGEMKGPNTFAFSLSDRAIENTIAPLVIPFSGKVENENAISSGGNVASANNNHERIKAYVLPCSDYTLLIYDHEIRTRNPWRNISQLPDGAGLDEPRVIIRGTKSVTTRRRPPEG